LDPALAEDIHAFNILTDLYEGLVSESATGELVPASAESWTVSGDELTYTFTLREDARWSNGDALTAHDFVRAFRRVAAPATASVYGFLLQPILHFAEVQNGSLPADELAVVAIDDRVLQIRLVEPTPQMLSVLAMPVALPAHVSAEREGAFSQANTFVGNGAYLLVGRAPAGPIRLRRSPTYWDAKSVAIEEVVYLPIVEPRAEFNMYRAGELDITNTVPLESVRALRENTPEQLRIAPTLALYYLAFDVTEPPLDNQALRQALTMAIDRERLVSLIGRGEQAAYGIVPPGVAGHAGSEFQWRNLPDGERVKQARALYQQSGYGEQSPLALTYTYDTGDIHEKIALAVSAMWRDTLGIDVSLEKMEWQYFLDTRENRSGWQIMRFAWFGDYNHASTFTNLFRSGDPQNLPGYANPDYDRLLAAASAGSDGQTRAARIEQAEATLLADHPIAPLYFYVSKHLVRPGIGGFEPNVLDRHPSKYLFFQEKP
jgi:ABC-type oligopeptide transport system substrate-binding subunit